MEANVVPFSIEEVTVSRVNSVINRILTDEAISSLKYVFSRVLFGGKIAGLVFLCGKVSEFF